MSQKKTFVCFANSRKEGGQCVVGKEKTDSGYAWIRPVGDGSKGELSNLEIGYDGRVGGAKPKFLDVVEIVVKERKFHAYQKENWLIDNNYCWKKKGECRQDRVRDLVDAPKSLWAIDCSSRRGTSDRIPYKDVQSSVRQSVYLVRADDVRLFCSQVGRTPQLRAAFSYKGTPYNLAVTDPIEDDFMVGESQCLSAAYLCVSLSEPFRHHVYKLVAGIMELE